MTTSEVLKESLRRIFDTQIPNYGDYNLVFASNSRAVLAAEAASGGEMKLRCYVLGYRWRPSEIVIAPFNASTLTAGSAAVAINMTNLHSALRLANGDVEISTSTGQTFRFGVQAYGELPDAHGISRELEQIDDAEDFAEFIESFLAAA
ncbi:hypothetical protein IV498_07910 [Paenarthrobacter sp. Z7-10]|uniref:hypothetical protein n=1 Tax=Paenarthrobacter sp. Z7-10 TaxID=2787635 RepID=UPI0022A8F69F|nr:hypothetical protein [Paenarthrobacter sp. Z7-10]MCZ2403108.1 hypothetical protein [Paenarthrobacter sp. Z7-10]